ncbi:HAD family hydrolase [Tautonia rosea]|uniref:hypothetical protein n=1 Tax=Tautonia rosea TaxID=2728037 RepID=UPI0014758E6E|nr:hypothetical protein [Tautonia rosea]
MRVASEGSQCSGRLDGANCKRAKKVEVMRRLLDAVKPPEGSIAYRDSRSDLPLRCWVDRGYLVTGSCVAGCRSIDRTTTGGRNPSTQDADAVA